MTHPDAVDRSVLVRSRIEDADAEDVAFWMSRTPTERIEALEQLRRWTYGDDQVDARLQRVLEFAERVED